MEIGLCSFPETNLDSNNAGAGQRLRDLTVLTGIEFPLALLGSTLLLALAGAGTYSLDTLIARRRGSVATAPAAERAGTRRAA